MAMLCFIGTSLSQEITGKVFDNKTNQPLTGAKISVKNKIETLTNNEGKFSLPCKEEVELSITFIGYTPKTIKASCGQNLNVGMSFSNNVLSDIEITATSSEDKTDLRQPASIVKLTDKELDRGNGLYLSDAINTNVPGVYMGRRTISGGQQFNIRGYGNGARGTNGVSSNFDGQGSKVYLNGIPVTDAEGITVMDDIDFASLSKVDVIKGPSGTLYGLAIAGVVNLQTEKAAKNETSISQNTAFGSYGLMRSTTQIAIGGEKSSLMVNYGRQKQDGYMVHTASHKDFVNLVGDFNLNEKQQISTYIGFSDSYDERNGELTIQQYDTMDYSGNARYIKNNAHSSVKSIRAGISHTYKFNKNISNTTSIFGTSQNMDNSSAGGWNDKSPLNYGLRSVFDKHFKLSDKISISGITGIEMQQMNTLAVGYRMEADSTNLDGYNVIGSIKSIQATKSATASYFTQWTLELPNKIDVTAGVGYSTMNLSLQDRLWSASNNSPTNTVPKEYRANYSNMLSPKVALNKQIKENASVYASYSKGYKAPVSSYFYIPTTGEVNRGLKPEIGTQIEIGTKGTLLNNKLYYSVALFNTKFSDKMTTVTVQNPSNTATLYSYIVNGGNVNNNGLELLVKYEAVKSTDKFFTSVSPFLNFTYSDFHYEDYQFETIGKGISNQDTTIVNDYSGNFVAGVSPIVFNAGVDFNTKVGVYGNVSFNHKGEMYFTSDELNQTKSYNILNAKLGYVKEFGKFSLDAYVVGSNLTGEQYYYMVFINQLPDAYIPSPSEINFYAGVKLKYNF